MGWVPQAIPAVFAPTIGRDSGFYVNDYGRRSTEDLTVPGKLERLQRDGTIPEDPFSKYDREIKEGSRPAYAGRRFEDDPLV
jgi:hypothetical protein